MRCSKTSFGIDCRLSGHGSFGSSQRHGLTIVTLRRMPNITQPRRWHSKQWHMEMRTLILGEAHLRQILSSYAAYYNEVQPRAGSRSGNGQQ